MSTAPFRWQDGERLIVFGNGTLAEAPGLLAAGYTLLTTERAAAQAPEVLARAGDRHDVAAGRVDEIAAELRSDIKAQLLVALGGGRVIDVAKALAAADPPRHVAAIPTTLSGAEMTSVHRHAAGVAPDTARVRPAIVINDPELSASQPVPELAASALNALGHAFEGPLTPLSNPVAKLSALEASRLLVAGLDLERAPGPGREDLALGSLLAGYVIGSTGYGLHHVLSQTLVRFTGIGHGPANAIMLAHSLGALERRFPAELNRVADALGENPAAAAARICTLTGTTRLRDLALTGPQLDHCADEASGRAELHLTPPPADRRELRELYAEAY